MATNYSKIIFMRHSWTFVIIRVKRKSFHEYSVRLYWNFHDKHGSENRFFPSETKFGSTEAKYDRGRAMAAGRE